MVQKLQLQSTQAPTHPCPLMLQLLLLLPALNVTVVSQGPTRPPSPLLSESADTATAALLRRGRAGVFLAGVWLPSKGSWASTLCRLTWASSAARSSADRPCSPKIETVGVVQQHVGLCWSPAERPYSDRRECCVHS